MNIKNPITGTSDLKLVHFCYLAKSPVQLVWLNMKCSFGDPLYTTDCSVIVGTQRSRFNKVHCYIQITLKALWEDFITQ